MEAIIDKLRATTRTVSRTLGPSHIKIVQYARKHLEECVRHDDCGLQMASRLPTRVIDVGTPDGSKEPYLLATADGESRLGQPEARYVALSYCWGPLEKNFRTTAENVAQLQLRIPWSRMPQTIKDAVEITRALGIRYLWVDALCIVQGPGGDWATEASKMGSVYGGAFLTIAAALGPDVSHGLSMSNSLLWRQYLYKDHYDVDQLPYDPLYSRAWALQERLLSPRLLIIGSSGLFWECGNSIATQKSGFYDRPLPEFTRIKCFTTPTDDVWDQIVQDYTCRNLSYEADKLPAIAGIASVYGAANGKTYLAGLWRESLLKDLFWQHAGENRRKQVACSVPTQYRAPSWSWASVDGNISQSAKWTFQTMCTEIRSIYVDLDQKDTAFNEQEEWIYLRGPLVEARVEDRNIIFCDHDYHGLRCDTKLDARVPHDTADNGLQWIAPIHLTAVWCLAVAQDSRNLYALILSKNEGLTSERGVGVYTRLGLCLIDAGYPEPDPLIPKMMASEKSVVYII